MKKIRFWLRNARVGSLPQSLTPAITALCLATTNSNFSFVWALIAVFGISMAHLCINLLDDYFDYKYKNTEIRAKAAQRGEQTRMTKCDYIVSGEATPKNTFIAALVFGLFAIVCGVFVTIERGYSIMVIAGSAALLGFFYSAKPISLCYRGLGEIVTFIMFGPLLMCGIYLAACGTIELNMLFFSIAIGLLVCNILFTHSILDVNPDKSAGKKTLCTLINNKNGIIFTSFLLTFLPFMLIIVGAISGIISYYYLFTLLCLPMAISLFNMMDAYVKHREINFKRQWWMGSMANWDLIVEKKLDWFLLRWYLSRNIVSCFCVIISIISIVLHFLQ